MCFGLNRDTSIKQGQIAHLDQNPANKAEDNLAFLCFEHHDRYDSSSSQSKNFTLTEVKHFRSELYEMVRLAFGTDVSFGQVAVSPPDLVSGHYISSGTNESADLVVTRVGNGRYHVQGHALWGTNRKYGPHIGELDFIAELRANTLEYSHPNGERVYRAVLQFSDEGLTVSEENRHGMFGMNVMFSGTYTKAT